MSDEITINAPHHLAEVSDEPISYRARVREYYLALGFNTPYQWAHYHEVPLARLARPLHESNIALVTTAAPFNPEAGDQGPGACYNGAAKFYSVYEFDVHNPPQPGISHVAYDRVHTHAKDNNTWLPLEQLKAAVQSGVIGGLAKTGFGLPTNRSQRKTCEVDCPDLLARIRAYRGSANPGSHSQSVAGSDSIDAVVLVPNCPVCHQSVSLAARHLEASGIPTVIMGCAKDIVEYVGVPRFLFSDFPLGNSAGKPDDAESQKQTLRMALELLESARLPRTTVQSPQKFADNHEWKRDYYNVSGMSEHELQVLRDDFDAQKKAARRVAR